VSASRSSWLLLRKDLLSLRRAPLLLVLLALYPLLTAGLVGLVAGYANSRPKVALVDLDNLPARTEIAGHTYHIKRLITSLSKQVDVQWMSPSDARHALDTGGVVGVITVPRGFLADLKSVVHSPTLTLETTQGGIAPRVREQMQALVYSLNLKLQDAYIAQALGYLRLIRGGGKTDLLGSEQNVLGIRRAKALIARMPPGPARTRLGEFLGFADLALTESQSAARSVAQPIRLDIAGSQGRSWLLSAEVQAYALALTVSILALVLAAGATAAERDENVACLLGRGLAPPRSLLGAKLALSGLLSLAVGLVIVVVFGLIVEIGHVSGGQPWSRLPLLLVGVAVTGAALGAIGTLIGALTRDGRSASLAALLIALPIVLIGLVPGQIIPLVGPISEIFPFGHAVSFFSSALFDLHPWSSLIREGLWLIGLAFLWSLPARLALPRLLES
jgi:ABC-type transport system involved in multi-copper enzyme maturation permease subunit